MDETTKKPIMGCDIGNAFAYASVLENADNDPVSLMPEKEALNRTGMPTAAYIPIEPEAPILVYDLRFGTPRAMKKYPSQVIEAIKLLFSQNTVLVRESQTQGNRTRSVRPEDVYAAVVRDLMKIANEKQKQLKRAPIYDLVFTFPASMIGDTKARERIQSSIESVVLDGHNLHVVSSLPEPAAVALDYLHYVRKILPGKSESKPESLTVLVVDLGHGTLDLAVVTAKAEFDDQPYEVHTYGFPMPPIGGLDFDENLENMIKRKLRESCHWEKAFTETQEAKIKKEARRIKHELSTQDQAELELEFVEDTPPIYRKEFEEECQDLVARVMESVEDQVQKATEAGIEIDRVILSGGGCNMPMIKACVQNVMKQLTGKDYPVELYRPSEAVSFGAARYAWYKKETVPDPPVPLKQKTNYSYGLSFEDPTQRRLRVKYLIPYQTDLPATGETTWISNTVDMDVDIRRSKVSAKTGTEDDLEMSADIVNKTFHGVPQGKCTLTMSVDDEHHVSVICRFDNGTVLRHGTGKYRVNETD